MMSKDTHTHSVHTYEHTLVSCLPVIHSRWPRSRRLSNIWTFLTVWHQNTEGDGVCVCVRVCVCIDVNTWIWFFLCQHLGVTASLTQTLRLSPLPNASIIYWHVATAAWVIEGHLKRQNQESRLIKQSWCRCLIPLRCPTWWTWKAG